MTTCPSCQPVEAIEDCRCCGRSLSRPVDPSKFAAIADTLSDAIIAAGAILDATGQGQHLVDTLIRALHESRRLEQWHRPNIGNRVSHN